MINPSWSTSPYVYHGIIHLSARVDSLGGGGNLGQRERRPSGGGNGEQQYVD